MSPEKRFTKIILAGLLTLAFVSATTAEISTAGGNDIVWKNSNIQSQLVVQCGPDEGNITSLNVSDSKIVPTTDSDSVAFSSQELQEESMSWGATHNVTLSCNNTVSESQNIDFARASLDFENTGSALLNELMEEGENSEAIVAEISADGTDVSVEDVSASSFTFSDSLFLGNNNPEAEEAGLESGSGVEVTLNPVVQSYTDDEVNLEFSGSGDLSGLETAWSFQPRIYRWSWEHQQTPPSEIDYEEITDGEFVYHTYLEDLENSDARAIKEQFVLTVRERGEDWDSPFSDKDGYEKLEIIEKDLSEVGGANYRLNIGDTGPINELPPGTYEFDLEFRYPEMSREPLLMDRVQVDKTSEFSGQVLDSGGNGVETSMALNDVESSSTQNVNAGSDGIFSTDINNDVFDINASFGSQPYSRVSMSEVNLDSSTGPESVVSSIGSEYWSDPSVNLEGLRAVNMMAVKFGYPTEDVKSLDMAFDSGALDPKDMKVYECNEWNFQGSDCMGSWNKVPENDISIDYASWRVSVDNANLYSTDSGDILMNAYVVGTSSEISLQNSIVLESSSIEHSGSLEASGTLVSENGERVNNANVTMSLVQGEEVVKSWSESSDSTGTFEFSETVDVDAGNYQLKVEASKNPYQSFEMMSEKTIEVYYETGIRLEAPTSKQVVQGNKTEIDITVSNTGQQPVENVDLSVSGVKSIYYSFDSNVNTLDSGESRSLGLALDLPSDYCNLPCGSPPQLDISVSGTSSEQEVSDSILTSIVLVEGDQETDSDTGTQETEDTETSESRGSTEDDSSSDSSASPISDMQEMTGDFVQKQGELNIALGLIFIFTMMLALSVKKKKGSGDDRRRGNSRGGGRPAVQRPPINSKNVDQEDSDEGSEDDNSSMEEEEASEEVEESESDSEDSDEGFECSVCGESFESESGRDLHEQAVH